MTSPRQGRMTSPRCWSGWCRWSSGCRASARPTAGARRLLSKPEQLRKALDLIKTILVPGADGKPLPLGQVNGALGQTIGNLLNGKKTAIGLLGAVITPMLTQASDHHRARAHSRHADAGGGARAVSPCRSSSG